MRRNEGAGAFLWLRLGDGRRNPSHSEALPSGQGCIFYKGGPAYGQAPAALPGRAAREDAPDGRHDPPEAN